MGFLFTGFPNTFATLLQTNAGYLTMMGSPIVVLDIGTSKVLCLVGELQADEKLRILGVGSSPCTGFRRSAIIDMAKVVQSIKTA